MADARSREFEQADNGSTANNSGPSIRYCRTDSRTRNSGNPGPTDGHEFLAAATTIFLRLLASTSSPADFNAVIGIKRDI